MNRTTRPQKTPAALGSDSAPIRRRVLAVALATGLVAAACTSGGDEPEATPDPGGPTDTVELGEIDLVGALARYDSCEAFLDDVKAEALERVGPYGFGQGGWGPAIPFGMGSDDSAGAMEQSPDARATATTTAPQSSDSGVGGAGEGTGGFSGTNNQEGGVDEPDLVKTDGEIMAVVDQDQLRILDVSDPANPTLVSSTPLAGYSGELLLHGDDLLVFQRVGPEWGGPIPLEDARGIGAPAATTAPPSEDEPNPNGGRIAPSPWWPNHEVTTVAHVDISDPANPETQRTWTVEGGYVSARLVDGIARVVLRSDPSSSLPFVYPSGQNAEDAAETANRAVIEASTVEDWVPQLTIADGDGDVIDESVLVPCDRLYRPSAFAGFGVVGVLTADVAEDGLADGMGVGVLSSGETVYASPTSLFVATNQWIEAGEQDDEASASDIMPAPQMGSQRTDVHQFLTEGASPAQYQASGSIDGRILNQFSMSEHDDHLRIAVTEGNWGESTDSSVVILARRGESLDEVGRVGGLGQGEQIYAVRFMGDRGYVVTFRQIDPLYTLDLADPANPQLLGELKIPGFSSYLHPVGDDLLAGVGQDATDEGRVTGSQISLFDVSDPANPERVAQLDLGEGSNSEVEHDHRAFLFWEGLAVLPYTSYQWTEQSESMNTGAIGVDIDAAARTLVERGRISHLDHPSDAIGEPSADSPERWERQYGSVIRRSVVIGDTLLTISDRGVLASSLASFEPGSWVNFGG